MSQLLFYDTYDADSDVPKSPQLQKVIPDTGKQPVVGPEKEPDIPPPPKKARRTRKEKSGQPQRSRRAKPGQVALFLHLAPNNPELSRFDPTGYDVSSESDSDDSVMTEIVEEYKRVGVGEANASGGDATTSSIPRSEERPFSVHGSVDLNALEAQANAALQHEEASEPQTTADVSLKRQRSGRNTPLVLDTQKLYHPKPEDTIATSPTLRKHVIPVVEGAAATLPALQSSSPIKDGAITSPQTEKLPSIRHHIGDSLTELAEAATQHDTRGQQHTHSHAHSLDTATPQSPIAPYHPYPSAHTSPSNHYTQYAVSPTSAISGPYYGSPPHYPSPAYFAARRSSSITANTPKYPSLPSGSSSSESQGPANSSIDGYSTSHTTPIDATPVASETPGAAPPLPSTMPIMTGYKCDEPDCQAPPFQTQYLLSSHRNVHSQVRNHFCPVPGCAHAENGKGFKRKNEMKRHSLVHKSPVYTCPFCPDREHKYPRPDNLQRHVRVHHMDKDRDDPKLREVLARRNDGVSKAPRRRRNTSASI